MNRDADWRRQFWRSAGELSGSFRKKWSEFRPARWRQLRWTFLVPFLFHRAYQPLNELWTVKTFGCGCPTLDDRWRFNANHFNSILWFVITTTCMLSVIASCRPIREEKRTGVLGPLLLLIAWACAWNWAQEGWM